MQLASISDWGLSLAETNIGCRFFAGVVKMPKLKKAPKNSYYFFMRERKAELEAQGYRFPRGLQDVASAVRGEWNDLPPAEKERYEALAKEAKEMEKTNYDNKFTTSGESYASLNRRLEAEQTEKAELKSVFHRIVRSEIPEERIYVLVQAIPSCEVGLNNLNEKKEYYPLEICFAAFSLRDGFICQYWTLVNTMTVPCGYASSAKDTSEETCLPQPGSKIFEREAPQAVNYNQIMSNIRQFVETWCSDYPDKKHMVFATDSNITSINGCLEWLVKNADENAEVNQLFLRNLKFYSLASLVIELAVLGHEIKPEYSSEIQQFRLSGSAENLLGSGCYDYRGEITCRYHNKEDYSQKMHICCLNYIVRRIFIILEEFCEVYSCSMTDRHKIATFRGSKMPDYLKERLPQPIRHIRANSSPEDTVKIMHYPDDEDRESPQNSRSDNLRNDDVQISLDESDVHFNPESSPMATACEFGKSSNDGKGETGNDVSVSTCSDSATEFDSCNEGRKRKRSSSSVSLDPAKYDRREDSTRSSAALRNPQPEAGWNFQAKSEPMMNKKDEFETFNSITQLPRGRGRGFRRIDSGSSNSSKKEESPGLPDSASSPPLQVRPLGRGQRGPIYDKW